MTPSPVRPRTVLIIVLVLLLAAGVVWTGYQFDQVSRRSESHQYHYAIELSFNTTIDNVTLLLPVPVLDNSPFFTASLLNGTAYGVSPDWNLTVVRENGTPMLAITSSRMVPEYHGYPIAIEPGASVLPTTLVPGHEYSPGTPVLVPVSVAVMETGVSEINTRDPVGHEPLFFPEGTFTPGSCVTPGCTGPVFDHPVPVYISYTAGRPVSLSLRVSVQGSNSVWRGGWLANSYADTVFVEVSDGTSGWIEGQGRLSTAEGVFY